jgi:hypothetical protein
MRPVSRQRAAAFFDRTEQPAPASGYNFPMRRAVGTNLAAVGGWPNRATNIEAWVRRYHGSGHKVYDSAPVRDARILSYSLVANAMNSPARVSFHFSSAEANSKGRFTDP